MQKRDYVVLAAGVLGAVKLGLEAFGYSIITDDQVNALANGIGAVFAIVAAWRNNRSAK